MLKVIELFSGVGAQRKALEEAKINHEVIAISEIDKFALEAYELLFGKTNNLGDIRKIEKLPKADLWTYSSPCTDVSINGKMKGLKKGSGTNSSLLWEVERLLINSKENNELPKFLLLENVKNLISRKFKPHFDVWCSFLESLGYKNFYKVINSKDYGVPQNRERIFLLSILDKESSFNFPNPSPLKVKLIDLLEKEVDERYFLSDKLIDCFTDMKSHKSVIRGLQFKPMYMGEKNYAFTITTHAGYRATDNYIIIPQATKEGYSLASVGDGIYTSRCPSKRGVVQKSKIPTLKTSVSDIGVVVNDKDDLISIRRLTPRECWRLMGWKDSDIDKVINKFSNTQFYKMAGNSIVINCLTGIFKQMKGG